jgi:hypothetical protein
MDSDFGFFSRTEVDTLTNFQISTSSLDLTKVVLSQQMKSESDGHP